MASVTFLHFVFTSVASVSDRALTPGGDDESAGTPGFAGGAASVGAAVVCVDVVALGVGGGAESAGGADDAVAPAVALGETGSFEAGPHAANAAIRANGDAASAMRSAAFRAD